MIYRESCGTVYKWVTLTLLTGYLRGLTGSAVGDISLSPEFKPRPGYVRRVFHLSLSLGGRSTHLAFHLHNSGHKTASLYLIYPSTICNVSIRLKKVSPDNLLCKALPHLYTLVVATFHIKRNLRDMSILLLHLATGRVINLIIISRSVCYIKCKFTFVSAAYLTSFYKRLVYLVIVLFH